MLAEPNTSSTDTDTNTAELLWKLSSLGFSLLSPNDQQDKIEQISKELDAGVADVKKLGGETEEDLIRKKFAELFNKAPVLKRGLLLHQFTYKFFYDRKLCEAILLFRQLDSNEQQETIEKMLNYLIGRIAKDVILERLSEECEEDFRLRRFIKLCSTYKFLLNNLIDEDKDWDLRSLHMHKSGKEEIELIKQYRYAEFYLGLSIIWLKARWASDPKCLIHLGVSNVGEGDHIIEKLVNETEEDFRLRRFTESFKQLQFTSQEDVVERIKNTVLHDLGIGISNAHAGFQPVRPLFDLEFMKVKTPNLRGSGGAVATQGGGQGAITQGGQRERLCVSVVCNIAFLFLLFLFSER